MGYVRHIRNALHALFPLFFRDLDVFPRNRKINRPVQPVNLLKFVILPINEERQQDAESDRADVSPR